MKPIDSNVMFIDFKSYVNAISEVDIDSEKYDGLLVVLRGGFYIGDILSRKFDIPSYYFNCQSYNDDKKQGDVKLIDFADIEGGHYLIIDDIYDTGKTIEYIKGFYTHCTFDVYCLVSKQERSDIEYSFFAKEGMWVEFWWESLSNY